LIHPVEADFVAGGLMIASATEALPERSELTRVSGVVDRAVKITSRGAISVRFDLDIKSASGEVVTLRCPMSRSRRRRSNA
jgi:hypothetical protein